MGSEPETPSDVRRIVREEVVRKVKRRQRALTVNDSWLVVAPKPCAVAPPGR